jgi:phosphoglycolate phosphatase-like HAD superfamily hydrolase
LRLVLWDIDGTLVHSAGYGRDAFADAFASVFGRRPERGLAPMAGRTDHDIALAVLELNGIAGGEELLPAFSDALASALAAKEAEMRAHGHAMPGARAALAALAVRDDAVQSVLTGNIEANAALKLAAFGLAELVDFELGAYGSDHRRRAELVAIARRRAQAKLGMPFAAGNTVLVGDTPLDIAAAREGGARVVAVATGPYGIEDLGEADAVLPDLTDTGAVVAACLSRR